jgi:hypothetical protein
MNLLSGRLRFTLVATTVGALVPPASARPYLDGGPVVSAPPIGSAFEHFRRADGQAREQRRGERLVVFDQPDRFGRIAGEVVRRRTGYQAEKR